MARDPGYAFARALRVLAYATAAGGRFILREDALHILPDAYALLDSGTTDAVALAYAADAVAYLDKGADIALIAIRKAKALNPNSVTVLSTSGWVHTYVGQFETAIADIERALRLNPLDPISGQTRSALGPILLGLGRIEEAIEMVEQSYHEAPGYGSTVFTLICGHWRAGHLDKAKRFARELLAINPAITVRYTLETSPNRHEPFRQLMRDALTASGIPEG